MHPRRSTLFTLGLIAVFFAGYFNRQLAPYCLTPEVPLGICYVVIAVLCIRLHFIEKRKHYLLGRNAELEDKCEALQYDLTVKRSRKCK